MTSRVLSSVTTPAEFLEIARLIRTDRFLSRLRTRASVGALFGMFAAGCTSGKTPMDPNDCKTMEPNQPIVVEIGGTYCLTVEVTQ